MMWHQFDPESVPSPCYVLGLDELEANLRIVAGVRERTGARILLSLKAFAAFCTFPLMRRYLDGVACSSPNEVMLGAREFGKEVHLCGPAYGEQDFEAMLPHVDHVVFNSVPQWERYRGRVGSAGKGRVQAGLRLNPEHSEAKTAIYDPCFPGSRLGVTAGALAGLDLTGLSGLHFHTLCENDSAALERTVTVVEERFAPSLAEPSLSWVNMGGGHLMTAEDYDLELLCDVVTRFRRRYGVEVYLEPGEAVALNAGVLVATVLDVVSREGTDFAILDTSASAHMPDVLEMPYRPEVVGAGGPGELAHTYQLGGQTCLAGDVIGEYSFAGELRAGQRITFTDMAHYTMVKNNTFNGVGLPAIAVYSAEEGRADVVREFDYEDFRSRLS